MRGSKAIINKARLSNPEVDKLITDPIKRLFVLVDIIDSSPGVIYAVKVESPFEGISIEQTGNHSSKSIMPESIYGKILLPQTVNIDETLKAAIKIRNLQKLDQLSSLLT